MILNTVALNYFFNELKTLSLSFIVEKNEAKLTEQQKAILESLMAWQGTEHQVATTKLASALIGFDFSPYMKKGKKLFELGMIVVPLKSYNSHNYTLNEPACAISGERLFSIKSGIGNSLPDLTNTEYVRLATKEEVAKFYSDMMAAEEKYIVSFVREMLSRVEIKVAK